MAKAMICANCGTVGSPKTVTKGSFALELLMWLLFLLPGLIYSAWRLSSRAKVCAACFKDELVPADSPRGRKLLVDFNVAAPR